MGVIAREGGKSIGGVCSSGSRGIWLDLGSFRGEEEEDLGASGKVGDGVWMRRVGEVERG